MVGVFEAQLGYGDPLWIAGLWTKATDAVSLDDRRWWYSHYCLKCLVRAEPHPGTGLSNCGVPGRSQCQRVTVRAEPQPGAN